MEPQHPSDLSAYELERLDNIKRNAAVLASLGLAGGSGLGSSPSARPIKRRKPAQVRPPAAPERRSSRLVDGAKAPDFYIANETASGRVTVGGDARALQQATQTATAAAGADSMDPLTLFGLGAMPEGEDDLLESERAAFVSLRDAKRAKASELGIEGYKIAQHRSLAEVVRRCPTEVEALRACWGFGGSGVRVDKYGAMFLEALMPHVPRLRRAHAAAKAEYEAAEEAKGSEEGEAGGDGAEGGGGEAGEGRGGADSVAAAARPFGQMPSSASELLPGEAAVYEALIGFL